MVIFNLTTVKSVEQKLLSGNIFLVLLRFCCISILLGFSLSPWFFSPITFVSTAEAPLLCCWFACTSLVIGVNNLQDLQGGHAQLVIDQASEGSSMYGCQDFSFLCPLLSDEVPITTTREMFWLPRQCSYSPSSSIWSGMGIRTLGLHGRSLASTMVMSDSSQIFPRASSLSLSHLHMSWNEVFSIVFGSYKHWKRIPPSFDWYMWINFPIKYL